MAKRKREGNLGTREETERGEHVPKSRVEKTKVT